jgi:hypothetical protein
LPLKTCPLRRRNPENEWSESRSALWEGGSIQYRERKKAMQVSANGDE